MELYIHTFKRSIKTEFWNVSFHSTLLYYLHGNYNNVLLTVKSSLYILTLHMVPSKCSIIPIVSPLRTEISVSTSASYGKFTTRFTIITCVS